MQMTGQIMSHPRCVTIHLVIASRHIRSITAIAGLAGFMLVTFWLCTMTGEGEPNAFGEFAWITVTSGGLALLWLLAAFGLGWPLRMLLTPRAEERVGIQLGLGVAAQLVIDAALGSVGWLQLGDGLIAWLIIGAGLLLTAVQLFHLAKQGAELELPHPLTWLAVPAVAVLCVASCSAPGWLWSTEFGGYDALSYHLQLPREWAALGQIQPLEHNIYSYLPGYIESAFYHLAILKGDAIGVAYTAQWLHALFTLTSAWLVHRLSCRLLGESKLPIAFILFLGTPWVVVVGSLAYNEMAVIFMFATAALVAIEAKANPAHKGTAMGLLIAVAVGAKLTAIGFVAVPLALLVVLYMRPRHLLRFTIAAASTAIFALSPYLVRNEAFSGNPVFPFATAFFGEGHWEPDQIATFAKAHMADFTLGDRFQHLWNEWLRFGIGPSPNSYEPWLAQWSILPWLGLGGVLVAIVISHQRRISLILTGMLFIQLAFWLFFTHLKSRFLLPTAMPLALLGSIGLHSLQLRLRLRTTAPIAVFLALWSVVPLWIFIRERNGAPSALIGKAGLLTGDDLNEMDRSKAGLAVSPAIAINHLLPEGSQVLLVGHATPFYFRLDRIWYQTTWDRGPLSLAMHANSDNPAQWAASLRKGGFTHILVDESMLRRWERSQWHDPLLTADRVRMLTATHAQLIASYPGNVALYRLVTGNTP